MKATKKIVGATAALVAAVALSAGSTFAWFATNSTVTATGMTVNVNSPSADNLVISNSSTWPSTLLNTASATDTGAKSLSPSTPWNADMDSAASTDLQQPDSNLAYVTNNGAVNTNTGLANEGATLYYAAATNGQNIYYVDYTFYLGGANKEITLSTTNALTVKINDVATDMYRAVSIQVYYFDSTDSPSVSKDSTPTTTLRCDSTDAVTLATSGTILSTAEVSNRTAVVLRVYLDGAYGGSSSTSSAYVNSSAAIPTQNLSISLTFALESTTS